ncbi:MAG: secretion system protein [Candidatus Aenigmatarchaeota archaeon]|nr:MAG: secretion system protein [Candidatus Aenigmarchaeota archaeon]
MVCTCPYEYDEDKARVRINCLGSIYGSSIEDFPECMGRVIDILLEVKKVNSVVLARQREYEYDVRQVRMLQEIAGVFEYAVAERFLSYKLESRVYPEWSSVLQTILLDLLRTDPIGAYVELLREIRNVKYKAKKAEKAEALKLESYIADVLEPLKQRLEETQLIKAVKDRLTGYHLGDRTLYRDLFKPSTRPNFMFTRYMVTPPEGAVSVDRYMVGDTKVEIFKLPHTTQHLYFVLPPEFRLTEDKYAILDAARQTMASYRPVTAELLKSERVREVFYNISRDVVRETAEKMGTRLSAHEIKMLASILTRYTAGYGILEVLLADEKIQDIYINSPVEKTPILINHADWHECTTNIIPTREDAEAWATRLRIQSGRPLDEANPVLDTDVTIPGIGAARFAVITRTLSPEGLAFAIRRHRFKPWTLPLFIRNRMLNSLAAGLLSFLIDGAVTLLIAGGRGAGKTSLLASLMLEILPQIRIVTIEDTLELPVKQLIDLGYNIESMKSRSVITKVETEMPADEALRTSLRLGDSCLIVGEIRSLEAKALWEAMRIGALSNVVAGTIHGESAYGVYDRVVNDLQVPPTSFKATDIIVICKVLRSADGLHRFRRVTEIVEVRKHWEKDPVREGGFVNLMEYRSRDDELKPTETLLNGESEVLNRIASMVREWAGNWSAVWENINLRAKIKQKQVEFAEKLKRPELLEARWTLKCNSRYHLLAERIRQELGYADAKRIYEEWLKWFKEEVKHAGG